MKITATISPDSPRHALWLRDFGTDTMPILSSESRLICGENLFFEPAYQLDVKAFSPEVRERVIESLSREYGFSREEIETDLDSEHGFPILAEGVTVHVEGEDNDT